MPTVSVPPGNGNPASTTICSSSSASCRASATRPPAISTATRVESDGNEERHHRVADELLHDAAVPLDLAPQALVVGTKDRLHVLRVECLRTGGEVDEVGEQHSHD